jgi:hypothetical protein
MAVGDAAVYWGSIANAASLTIQPSSGVENVIHNFTYAGKVEIYRTDGSNPILILRDDLAGALLGLALHVTNANYLTIKNTSGSTMYVGADGVVTKST